MQTGYGLYEITYIRAPWQESPLFENDYTFELSTSTGDYEIIYDNDVWGRISSFEFAPTSERGIRRGWVGIKDDWNVRWETTALNSQNPFNPIIDFDTALVYLGDEGHGVQRRNPNMVSGVFGGYSGSTWVPVINFEANPNNIKRFHTQLDTWNSTLSASQDAIDNMAGRYRVLMRYWLRPNVGAVQAPTSTEVVLEPYTFWRNDPRGC